MLLSVMAFRIRDALGTGQSGVSGDIPVSMHGAGKGDAKFQAGVANVSAFPENGAA